MTQQPTVHLIHASDAPQHLGKLKEILDKLKAENRIADFVTLSPEDPLANFTAQIKDNDLVLTLLTQELEPRKEEIESMLKALKTNNPEVKVAEAIVDHVPYENEFITFPSDLRPIRGREDMDAVWNDIEQNLKQIFPVQKAEHVPPADWKKYVKYAIAIIVLGLVVWLVLGLMGGDEPEAAFKYKVFNPASGELYNDTAECYAPCIVYFDNESSNYDIIAWNFKDTIVQEEDPRYAFVEPGEHLIKLTASKKSKENTAERTITVKSAPYADFEIINNGCVAPCQVGFSNNSEYATNYVWEFGNNARRSDEENPQMTYQAKGEYTVKLVASNPEGLKDELEKKVTIREDNSPFAQFNVRYGGPYGRVPQKLTFVNMSKNANQYIWNFGDGSNSVTVNNASPVTHQYNQFGKYTVTLTAKQGSMSDHFVDQVSISKIIINDKYIRQRIDKYENILKP